MLNCDGFMRRPGETARELASRAGRAPWADLYYLARFSSRENSLSTNFFESLSGCSG